jgi:hypothetical protein
MAQRRMGIMHSLGTMVPGLASLHDVVVSPKVPEGRVSIKCDNVHRPPLKYNEINLFSWYQGKLPSCCVCWLGWNTAYDGCVWTYVFYFG